MASLGQLTWIHGWAVKGSIDGLWCSDLAGAAVLILGYADGHRQKDAQLTFSTILTLVPINYNDDSYSK